MTKYIMVTLEGWQLDTDDSPIILTSNGSFHLTNDKYYVQYDEVISEGNEVLKSRMKISPTQLELTKRGSSDSQISFDKDMDTHAIYRTPYGNLCFDVKTSELRIKETEELIEVELEYTLYSEGARLSDHKTLIRIVPDLTIQEEM